MKETLSSPSTIQLISQMARVMEHITTRPMGRSAHEMINYSKCVYCRNIKFVIIFSSEIRVARERLFLMTDGRPSTSHRDIRTGGRSCREELLLISGVRIWATHECVVEEDETTNWIICKTVLQVCYFRLLSFSSSSRDLSNSQRRLKIIIIILIMTQCTSWSGLKCATRQHPRLLSIGWVP